MRGRSSAGRAPALQAGGRGFESHRLHHSELDFRAQRPGSGSGLSAVVSSFCSSGCPARRADAPCAMVSGSWVGRCPRRQGTYLSTLGVSRVTARSCRSRSPTTCQPRSFAERTATPATTGATLPRSAWPRGPPVGRSDDASLAREPRHGQSPGRSRRPAGTISKHLLSDASRHDQRAGRASSGVGSEVAPGPRATRRPFKPALLG